MKRCRKYKKSEYIEPKSLSHDDLARNLASYLTTYKNKATWLNIWFSSKTRKRAYRPDIVAVNCTLKFPRLYPIAYEIKVSKADFQSDVKKQKYLKYADFATYIYFATPKNLIKNERTC